MSITRGSLRSFLETAKTNLHNAILNQQRVTLVMGNDSADLDSITSAIVLAYIRSNSLETTPLTNPSVNKHTPPSQYPPLYIPLANIPRADVKIRPELLKLLPYANLEPSHIITLDDLVITAPAGLNPDDKENLQPNLTRLLLTDHNNLAGPLAPKFTDRVIGCIDHHVDEKVIPNPPPIKGEPRIIEVVGSCTSLVTQYCRPLWDVLSSSTSSSASNAPALAQNDSSDSVGIDDSSIQRTWDAQIAHLALAPILVDTGALQDKTKTVSTDAEAVKYLEAKVQLAESSPGSATKSQGQISTYDRQAFYTELNTAKRDLSPLTLPEILRKDYKQYNNLPSSSSSTSTSTTSSSKEGVNLGISSVVKSLTWQIDNKTSSPSSSPSQFLEVITNDFATPRKLDLYAIMTTSTHPQTGKFQRELLLKSLGSRCNEVVRDFERKYGEVLGLEEWKEKDFAGSSLPSLSTSSPPGNKNENEEGVLKVWYIRKTKNSRKQVAPILKSAILGEENGGKIEGQKL